MPVDGEDLRDWSGKVYREIEALDLREREQAAIERVSSRRDGCVACGGSAALMIRGIRGTTSTIWHGPILARYCPVCGRRLLSSLEEGV